MATHAMPPVDAAWYHIDGTVNLALVTGIPLTRQPLDFEKVKAVYRRRLARFDRFSQRVVETGFPLPVPRWEDMPDFDIGHNREFARLLKAVERSCSATSRVRAPARVRHAKAR